MTRDPIEQFGQIYKSLGDVAKRPDIFRGSDHWWHVDFTGGSYSAWFAYKSRNNTECFAYKALKNTDTLYTFRIL